MLSVRLETDKLTFKYIQNLPVQSLRGEADNNADLFV